MSFKDFIDKYFFLNLKDFPNIAIDLEINKVIFSIALGLILASFIINLNRGAAKSLITKLTRHSAYSEDGAKTLEELKINPLIVKYLLSSNKRLSGIVRRVGEKTYTYEEYVSMTSKRGYKEEKVDFSSARFYIAEQKRDEASEILNMRDTSVISSILFALLILSVSVCIILLMPSILPFIDALLKK